jgi:hypothetical protein
VTMQLFVRGNCTMIAAPVQSDVDGIPKGSHCARVPPTGSQEHRLIVAWRINYASLYGQILHQYLGHSLVGPEEVRGEILGKQGIGFGAGDGFLGVLAVLSLRTRESD